MKETDISEMNLDLYESNVLLALYSNKYINQRILSEAVGYSLGVTNRSLKSLCEKGYLNNNQLTKKALNIIKERSPKNAIILAAGMGMRMIPINRSVPKGMLEVKNERLVERLIRQLHEVGINDITIVVGYMKDSFEYLIDKYGVELIYNPEYERKNNLYSLKLAEDRLSNTYIIPCDIYCKNNPFRSNELYSWYMVTDSYVLDSSVRANRKTELSVCKEREPGNKMVGICYMQSEDSDALRFKIKQRSKDVLYNNAFWEEALYEKGKMSIKARIVEDNDIVEINTYEQLREFDSESDHLKSDAIRVIASVFDCDEKDIKQITVLKKGMTNRSFLFSVGNEKYIMRIPGEGTDKLINRQYEAEVFHVISGIGLCDDPVYLDPQSGYKITKYLENVRTCDPTEQKDLELCMGMLHRFHELKLKVDHTFDIFEQIEFYERLWDGEPSIYIDYPDTKKNVFKLKQIIERLPGEYCLTHIDAVPDNFLFYMMEGDDREHLQLTDWEYSAMQDPHVDIAMFCIYSLYNKEQCDRLIDIYFDGKCDKKTRKNIYCYISACGLLWSNWCEYKRKFGVEFGEYSLRQYRYAKEFYKYAAYDI